MGEGPWRIRKATTLDLALKNGFKLNSRRRNGCDVRKGRDKGTQGSAPTQRTEELSAALETDVWASANEKPLGETCC